MQGLKPTLIIVDDVKALRDRIRAIVEPEYEVVGEAVDGMQALEQAITLRPRLIVMDVVMPRLSGIEATRKILESKAPAPKIIIVSAHTDDKTVLQAFEAGATDYLFKPVDEDKLRAVLAQAVKTAA